MDASLRPWFTSGVALVGATAIALAPVAPLPTASPVAQVRAATAAVSAQFDLTALDIPYILTLPIVRQYIRNWAQNWAVYLQGLAQAGVGAAQSLFAIPGVTVEIIQEVFALDFVAAFDTFTTAVRDSVVAVGQPLLDSLIWRNQKLYAVQTALQSAVPLAFIDVANGFLLAGNVVVTSLIEGTQNLVGAFLTFNLGNIINAAIDGTVNFLGALGDGAGLIVDGIESAQLGISTALAVGPPPPTLVADVSTMRAFSAENTIAVSGGSDDIVADVPETTVPETVSEGSDTTGDVAPVVEEVKAADVDDDPPLDPVTAVPDKLDSKDGAADIDSDKATETKVTPGVDKSTEEAKDDAGVDKPTTGDKPSGPDKSSADDSPSKDGGAE